MALPFSQLQFFEILSAYNQAVWPAQLALTALAVACVVTVVAKRAAARAVGWGLAAKQELHT